MKALTFEMLPIFSFMILWLGTIMILILDQLHCALSVSVTRIPGQMDRFPCQMDIWVKQKFSGL